MGRRIFSKDSLFRISGACAVVGAAAAVVFFIPRYGHPPVGTYVAILGVVATLVTLRPAANNWEKAIWVMGLFALGLLEIENLYHDRAEHDIAESAARQKENQAFKAIADGIDNSIKNSQKQFDVTMGQIGTTLEAAQEAVANTQPKADVRFQSIVVPSSNGMDLQANTPLHWNLLYRNFGEIPAEKFLLAARVYVGRLDNLDDQKRIVRQFNAFWIKHAHEARQHLQPVALIPAAPTSVNTFEGVLTNADMSKLVTHIATIYFVVRFSWSDPTGQWAADYCVGLQDPASTGMMHPCLVGNQPRHKFEN